MLNSYFFGSSSGGGYFSCFRTNPNGYTYILKGGPGTGKSSIMRAVAEKTEKNDISCERYFCSSDPCSLDAVVFPSLGVSIVDGTPPHCREPVYPGADSEIINLGEYWDKNKIFENRQEIIGLTDKNHEFHAKSKKLIASAFSLFSDGNRIYGSCLNKDKIKKYACGIASKRIKRLSAEIGITDKKLFEAVTPAGCVFMNDTADGLCDEKTVLDDPFGTAAAVFLEEIRDFALSSGYNVIVSPSLIDGKSIEHLIIKELSIGFFVKNILFQPELSGAKTVSMRRFYDNTKLRNDKIKLAFLKKSTKEIISEACEALKNAGAVHDELEKIYISAMDFDKINALSAELSQRVWSSEWLGDLFNNML